MPKRIRILPGFDSQTQAALNELRDRCGMPDVPTSLSKEEGLELIANERRIELAAEGFRSDDMYRYSDEYWNKHINFWLMTKIPVIKIL